MLRLVPVILLLALVLQTATTAFAPHTRTLRTGAAPRSASASFLLQASSSTTNVDSEINDCLSVLNTAAESRAEDPEVVFDALTNLEKLQRNKAKTDPNVAQDMLDSLNGSWRLIFTTGTADTQSKIKGKVNYFPLKVSQHLLLYSLQ